MWQRTLWLCLLLAVQIVLCKQDADPADMERRQQQGQNVDPQAQPADEGRRAQGRNRDPPEPPRQSRPPPDPQQGRRQAPAEGNRERAPPKSPDQASHISQLPDCEEDINKYCREVSKTSDIAVLECLQDAGEDEATPLTSACEHMVWEFKVNLTRDERFKTAATKFCGEEMHKIAEMNECTREQKSGYMLSCMLDFKHNVTAEKCRKFLTRTERLAFSDFRLVGPFVEHCGQFVKAFECGSIEPPNPQGQDEGKHHSQGQTMECLIQKVVEHHAQMEKAAGRTPDLINKECRHEIMRISELQADDYHLDRPLYFACRADRDVFCPKVQAGDGQVFQCLIMHKEDPRMSEKCRVILVERSQLLAEDYKISHPLVEACQKDIQHYNCAPRDLEKTPEHYHLNYLLLCLENTAHTSQELQPMCTEQLVKHRQLMMSDFRMSPELVLSCAKDIEDYCEGQMLGGGRTLQCLMQVTQRRDKDLSAGCSSQLRQLLKVADPGSNYRVDRALQSSCQEIIQGKCREEATSEPNVLSCLMRHLDDDEMTDECEDRLLEIQYFMARDWTMDAALYKACRVDAKEKCHADENWHKQQADDTKPDTSGMVLSCLYRHAYTEYETPAERLSKKCTHEVRRVLRERAARVNLLPDIEEACRMALSVFCSRQSTEPEEEMNCLQENMDGIQEDKEKYGECAAKLAEFTEMEAEDVKLNRVLSKACRPVISRYCQHLTDEDIDHGDVMECLVQHKGEQEMTDKCSAYVKHFELVSMRDYHFSFHFKKSCADDIKNHCAEIGNDKTAIVHCLSEIVFRHRVLGEGDGLQRACKKQLNVEYLDIDKADADSHKQLKKLCKKDIDKTKCHRDGDTVDDVTECLRQNRGTLEPDCEALIFKRQKIEFAEPKLDIRLKRMCKEEIESLCSKADNVLACLKRNRKSQDMSEKCLSFLEQRTREQAQDIRLQPNLLVACKKDLERNCPKQYQMISEKQYEQHMIEGAAVNCLRKLIAGKEKVHLNSKCENEVHRVILESEIDPQLDVVFYRACKEDLSAHCGAELAQGTSHGELSECIKATYHEHRLKTKGCRQEIARRVSEELTDIHLDPYLHEACALDLKHYCNDVPPGEGRLISCLLSAFESTNTRISKKCRARLEDRKKLWDVAAKEDNVQIPDDVAQFASLVLDSPIKNRLLTIFFVAVGIIFCWGLCCGRATKRIRREIKNK